MWIASNIDLGTMTEDKSLLLHILWILVYAGMRSDDQKSKPDGLIIYLFSLRFLDAVFVKGCPFIPNELTNPAMYQRQGVQTVSLRIKLQ